MSCGLGGRKGCEQGMKGMGMVFEGSGSSSDQKYDFLHENRNNYNNLNFVGYCLV